MRHFILILSLTSFLLSCGQTDTKQKELELRERELALKEKELAIKEKDAVKKDLTTNQSTTATPNNLSNSCISKELLGEWVSEKNGQNGHCVLTISEEEDNYIIKIEHHSYAGTSENVTKCKNGQLKCTVPSLGESDVIVSDDGRTLRFIGEKFDKN